MSQVLKTSYFCSIDTHTHNCFPGVPSWSTGHK